MVCLGNICRSPIAEGVMQQLAVAAGLNWQVASAGTNGYHTGEPPHKYSRKICRQNGYDIGAQRAARFKVSDFDEYDHIYVMALDVYNDVRQLARTEADLQKVQLFLEALFPGEQREVPDPWYGDEAGYGPVFQLIRKGSQAIIAKHAIITYKENF
ncbi:MAG: low molecular weight phosphotyrosine protein phosphatase [Sphingobacteriales bacterium]|nr:MAG: low molecular weight phosphotyrosine protein phosphatase [Sphingobacteriales bacterium]